MDVGDNIILSNQLCDIFDVISNNNLQPNSNKMTLSSFSRRFSLYKSLSSSRFPISGHYRSLPPFRSKNHYSSQYKKQPFFKKLRRALKNTKTEWYHIPVGIGISVVAFTQLRRRSREGLEDEPTNRRGPGHRVEQIGGKEARPMGSWYIDIPVAVVTV